VGNGLLDYGNLVHIKHSNGYVTAYTHAERILVNRGDTVTKEQAIGYAGKTGDVTSPPLHFEIRHNFQPADPRSLLVASH
jgi:murein DD-endopeptidase MepM/ murein hydrolase activator NlpD